MLFVTFFISAGAFLNFFNTVWDKKSTTELILQGVKKRRKDPLPEVPKEEINAVVENGDLDNDIYSVIKNTSDVAPDSPYVEVALRNSLVESDSYPSSPDHTQASKDKLRSRASTCDSREFKDVEGLYAKVDKKSKFSYIKTFDKQSSDDDEEMIWQDNAAYESNSNYGEETPLCHLKNATISDRPYATVPFTPKSHMRMVKDNEKFATLPHDWSKREPIYSSIEQIKASINANKENFAFENDSSISSKSKDSMGSLLDLNEKGTKDGKRSSNSKWFMQDPANNDKTEKVAPMAKPEVHTFLFFIQFISFLRTFFFYLISLWKI